jgi:hypothetical protein
LHAKALGLNNLMPSAAIKTSREGGIRQE